MKIIITLFSVFYFLSLNGQDQIIVYQDSILTELKKSLFPFNSKEEQNDTLFKFILENSNANKGPLKNTIILGRRHQANSKEVVPLLREIRISKNPDYLKTLRHFFLNL